MPKTRQAPKRTRRVSLPFDARLEVRMYSTELAKLKSEAAERGMTASDLARFQLGDLIAAEPPVPTADQGQTPEGPENAAVDVAEAIAAAWGLSYGHALLKLKLGKVAIDGEPLPENSLIPADRLAALTVDGEPLPG